jgi:regulator of RNase E activity RraA
VIQRLLWKAYKYLLAGENRLFVGHAEPMVDRTYVRPWGPLWTDWADSRTRISHDTARQEIIVVKRNGVVMDINQDFCRPELSIQEEYEGLSAAIVADVMGKSNCTSANIKPISERAPSVVGTALTVETPAGSNYAIHKAIEIAEPGDVIVADAGGFFGRAVWGELMSRYSYQKGLCCAVIDGAVRDSPAHRDLDLPVYCKGVTPKGPEKIRSGSVGSTISCDGVTVNPGDIVVGDGDGVAFVPRNEAQTVLAKATERADLERTWAERIETTDERLLEIINEE